MTIKCAVMSTWARLFNCRLYAFNVSIMQAIECEKLFHLSQAQDSRQCLNSLCNANHSQAGIYPNSQPLPHCYGVC